MTYADNFVEYVTVQGDRLDSISRKHYGDSSAWASLIEANPTMPILRTYPPGLRIRVPVLTLRNSDVKRTALPPWKT
jgi:phage tail protein X